MKIDGAQVRGSVRKFESVSRPAIENKREQGRSAWCATPKMNAAESSKSAQAGAIAADIRRIIDAGRSTTPFGARKVEILQTRLEALGIGRPASPNTTAINGEIEVLLANGVGNSPAQLARLDELHVQLRAEHGLEPAAPRPPPTSAAAPIAGSLKMPPVETCTRASYQEAQRIWGDFKKSVPDFKKQVTEAGPAVGIDPSKTAPVDASRFRPDLTLPQYQELRSDLLLQMRLHPEQANNLMALAKQGLGKLPQSYQHNFSTFVGNERVSGMQQGALEWQRQLVTKQSSGDPERPSLYDARGLTDYSAYQWMGDDKNKMVFHLYGRGGNVDGDRALTNAYRMPQSLLIDYLKELDRTAGLK